MGNKAPIDWFDHLQSSGPAPSDGPSVGPLTLQTGLNHWWQAVLEEVLDHVRLSVLTSVFLISGEGIKTPEAPSRHKSQLLKSKSFDLVKFSLK